MFDSSQEGWKYLHDGNLRKYIIQETISLICWKFHFALQTIEKPHIHTSIWAWRAAKEKKKRNKNIIKVKHFKMYSGPQQVH